MDSVCDSEHPQSLQSLQRLDIFYINQMLCTAGYLGVQKHRTSY